MKKIIFTFLLASFSLFSLQAQVIDTLSTNHDTFMQELKQKFDETNRSDLKSLYKEFETQIKDGKIPDHVIDKLIVSSNNILKMRGKAYPQLQKLLERYLALNAIPLQNNEWDQFQNTLLQVMSSAKKGDTKSSLEFIDFVIPLFKDNALYFSKAKVWSLEEESFELSRIGFVQDGEARFQHSHLQYFIAFLFTARESFVHATIQKLGVHIQ